MPKHIASGLKYLAAVKLKDAGRNHQEIADELNVDRSTISHYLNGRNLSWNSIDVARTIIELSPLDFLKMVEAVFDEPELNRKIVNICRERDFKVDIKDSCSSDKVRTLKDFLLNEIKDFNGERLHNFQTIRLNESELLQLADLLIGAVGYENRVKEIKDRDENFIPNADKLFLVSLLKAKMHIVSFENSTPYSADKFNILVWEANTNA